MVDHPIAIATAMANEKPRCQLLPWFVEAIRQLETPLPIPAFIFLSRYFSPFNFLNARLKGHRNKHRIEAKDTSDSDDFFSFSADQNNSRKPVPNPTCCRYMPLRSIVASRCLTVIA